MVTYYTWKLELLNCKLWTAEINGWVILQINVVVCLSVNFIINVCQEPRISVRFIRPLIGLPLIGKRRRISILDWKLRVHVFCSFILFVSGCSVLWFYAWQSLKSKLPHIISFSLHSWKHNNVLISSALFYMAKPALNGLVFRKSEKIKSAADKVRTVKKSNE